MNRQITSLGMLVFLISIGSSAMAKERRPRDRGVYGGVGLTYNRYDLSESALNSNIWVVQNPTETRVDNQALGHAFHIGLRINRSFAIELAYIDFGTAHYHLGERLGFTQSTSPNCGVLYDCPVPPSFSPSDYSLQSSIVRFAVKAAVPIKSRWTIDGRLGMGVDSWRASNSESDRNSGKSSAAVIGVGASFAVTQQLRLHLDCDRFVPFSLGDSGYASDVGRSRGGALYENVARTSIAMMVEYRL